LEVVGGVKKKEKSLWRGLSRNFVQGEKKGMT
jgi:hypothetical protein